MSPNFLSRHPREDAVMKAQVDVTEALRRTMGLMQSELERSVLSVQMLGERTLVSAPINLTYAPRGIHGFA